MPIPRAVPPTATTPQTARTRAEIEARLGFLPPFFAPALTAPVVLNRLWRLTRTAYLDNPLPAELKQRLIVHVSRLRSCTYGVVVHSCELRALGLSGRELLDVLQAPLGGGPASAALLRGGGESLAGWPLPGSPDEARIVALATHAFARDDLSEQCVAELRRLLGPGRYERLAALLSYIETCDEWLRAHPEISYEDDPRVRRHLPAMLREEPLLRSLLNINGDARERCARTLERATGELTGDESVENTLHAVLGALGSDMGWSHAAVWIPTRLYGTPRLRCATSWQDERAGTAFAEANRALRLDPGDGLPARAWESGQARWIADVTADPHATCAAEARQDGLRGCYLLPVRGRDGVVALLELVSTDSRRPDPIALETLDVLAARIGEHLEQRGAQPAPLLHAA